MAVALVLRLTAISNHTDVSDEGIRGLQLRLMAAGFRPVSEIYASQGPLSLTALYPFYVLFGGDIVAARLAVVVYSLVGLLAVYWLACRLAGPIAGLAASGMLAVSPIYLENSRLAFVEVPSLVLATAGVAVLLRLREGGKPVWLVVSSTLLAIGTLVKWMAGLVGLAALPLLAVPGSAERPASMSGVQGWRAGLGRLMLYGAVALAVSGFVVFMAGPAQVYEQLVAYRLGARAVRGLDVLGNTALIRQELAREGIGLLLLAVLGSIALVRARRVEAASLTVWFIGAVLLLLVYSPLWSKHMVYLLPPLVILAGVAAAAGAQAITGLARRERAAPLNLLCLGGAVLYVSSLPWVIQQDRRVIGRQSVGDALRHADDLHVIAAVTTPNDFIVMDDAYLAAMTGRLVPPQLADLSWTRILSRVITSEQARNETERFGARVVVVQDDHLGQLPRYVAWLDRNYLLVKSYTQRRPSRYRRVYLRRDADLSAARSALSASIQTPVRAELGPAALLGYSLERRDVRAGSRFALTLHWEALVGHPPEHHLVVRLRTPDGHVDQENRWPVGDGEQELANWGAGQWHFQTMMLQVNDDLKPGTYGLTLALDPPGNRRGVDSLAGSGAELEAGPITVR